MNDARFGEIVSQYEHLIFTICYQFTRDHHIAEDLVQETFLSAYRHRDACPEEQMKPWLARIAANKAKDYLKSAYNRKVMTPGEDGLPESTGTVLFITPETPEDLTMGRETLEAIQKDIHALKEPYNKVAVMYFLVEQSVEEISQRLNRPPKTVHTQIFRAKKQLQQKLKGGGAIGTI